jgi:hypothetical protein
MVKPNYPSKSFTGTPEAKSTARRRRVGRAYCQSGRTAVHAAARSQSSPDAKTTHPRPNTPKPEARHSPLQHLKPPLPPNYEVSSSCEGAISTLNHFKMVTFAKDAVRNSSPLAMVLLAGA